MKKIIFLGQKKIGELCFAKVLKEKKLGRCDVVAVSTNFSDDVWWQSNSIFKACREEKIKAIDNQKRNEADLEPIIKNATDPILVSVQHPWIVSQRLLSYFGENAFNMHGAELPKYKGHNCCNHAILNSEKLYKSTIHQIRPEVDAGPILFTCGVEVSETETAFSLYHKVIDTSLKMFSEFFDKLLDDKLPKGYPQSGEGVFYPRNSIDLVREVKDMSDLAVVDRTARALYFPPFEPAYFFRNGEKVYLMPGESYENYR